MKKNKQLQALWILTMVLGGLLSIPIISLFFVMMIFPVYILLGLILKLQVDVRQKMKNWQLTVSAVILTIATIVATASIIFISRSVEQGDFEYNVALILATISWLITIGAYVFFVIAFMKYTTFMKMPQTSSGLNGYDRFSFLGDPVVGLGIDAHDEVDGMIAITESDIDPAHRRFSFSTVNFLIRASLVVTLFMGIMIFDYIPIFEVVRRVFLAPYYYIIGPMVASAYAGQPEAVITAHLQAWGQAYLEFAYVIVFGLLLLPEILRAIKSFKWKYVWTIPFGYGISLLLNIAFIYIGRAFGMETSTSANQQALDNIRVYAPVMMFVGSAILAPLAEEFVFRQSLSEGIYRLFVGVMYQQDEKKYRIIKDVFAVFSIFLTSFIFAYVHVIEDPIHIFLYLGMAIGMTISYFLGGRNVFVAVGVHMINNTIASLA